MPFSVIRNYVGSRKVWWIIHHKYINTSILLYAEKNTNMQLPVLAVYDNNTRIEHQYSCLNIDSHYNYINSIVAGFICKIKIAPKTARLIKVTTPTRQPSLPNPPKIKQQRASENEIVGAVHCRIRLPSTYKSTRMVLRSTGTGGGPTLVRYLRVRIPT